MALASLCPGLTVHYRSDRLEYRKELDGLLADLLLEPGNRIKPAHKPHLRLIGLQLFEFFVNVLLWQQNMEDLQTGPVRLLARCVSSRIANELLPLADGLDAQELSSAEDEMVYLPVIRRKWLGKDFRIWRSNLAFPGCLVSVVRLLRFDCVRYRPPPPPDDNDEEDEGGGGGGVHYYHYPLMLVAWLFVTGQLRVDQPAFFREPCMLGAILRATDAFRGNARFKAYRKMMREEEEEEDDDDNVFLRGLHSRYAASMRQ